MFYHSFLFSSFPPFSLPFFMKSPLKFFPVFQFGQKFPRNGQNIYIPAPSVTVSACNPSSCLTWICRRGRGEYSVAWDLCEQLLCLWWPAWRRLKNYHNYFNNYTMLMLYYCYCGYYYCFETVYLVLTIYITNLIIYIIIILSYNYNNHHQSNHSYQ